MRCETKYCRREIGRNPHYCNTCYSRIWRANNPEKAAYINLKSHAKKRGISFDLSYESFLQFAIATEYIYSKGRKKNSMTIDRIDESIGYVEGNLQLLSNSENVKKSLAFRFKKLSYEFDNKGIPYNYRFKANIPPDLSEVPF